MWLRISVLGLGVVVFILLLFADKTNLNDKDASAIQASASQEGLLSGKRPLAPDVQLDKLIEGLASLSGKQKASQLDSIILKLRQRKRFEHASDFAEMYASIDSSLDNSLRIGELSYLATKMEYIAADSSLFSYYSQKAIKKLEEVVETRPADEKAQLLLGLSYVSSGRAENSMKGILTIRKIVEQNPNNPEANFHLGKFSLQTGQLDKAEQRLLKALEVRSNYYEAKYQLAILRVRQDRRDEAKALLQEMVDDPGVRGVLKIEVIDLLNNI